MNLEIAGCTLQKIVHQSDRTQVYAGVRQSDQRPVMIKVLRADYPSLAEIAQLRHEFSILNSLECPGIVQALALESYQNGLALVLEDYGGITLKQFLQPAPLTVSEFLNIATQLAAILADLHHSQIVHKDINPCNILIHPQTGQIKLIDFSIASRLSQEKPTAGNLSLLEGTLPYLSPEQTGRMNRTIDYRSDFYALGVTCYEMLTGQLPF